MSNHSYKQFQVKQLLNGIKRIKQCGILAKQDYTYPNRVLRDNFDFKRETVI